MPCFKFRPKSGAGQFTGIRSLDDLLASVAVLEDEEELGDVRVLEGVAASIASSGEWLLFKE